MLNHESTGICTACKEHTLIIDPCCGAPILFEGEHVTYEDVPFYFVSHCGEIMTEPDIGDILETHDLNEAREVAKERCYELHTVFVDPFERRPRASK